MVISMTVKKTSLPADDNNNKPSSFSKAASTFFSFGDRRRKQKRTEIIVNMSELHLSSFTTGTISLLQRRRDSSDCELVGLQLLAEEKYNDDYENNDNWDELSLDCEEDESYSSNHSTTTILPISLPPIQSPTSIMTKKLHPLSKDRLFF